MNKNTDKSDKDNAILFALVGRDWTTEEELARAVPMTRLDWDSSLFSTSWVEIRSEGDVTSYRLSESGIEVAKGRAEHAATMAAFECRLLRAEQFYVEHLRATSIEEKYRLLHEAFRTQNTPLDQFKEHKTEIVTFAEARGFLADVLGGKPKDR